MKMGKKKMELKNLPKKKILVKKALDQKMGPMEIQPALLQRETKCKARHMQALKKNP